jgi:putative ABC transport system ATP-binding protein
MASGAESRSMGTRSSDTGEDMNTVILSIENIIKRFKSPEGTITVLKSIDLKVMSGEITVLNGPSGSGKTTLLLCAGGLLAPDSGEVKLENVSLYNLDINSRTRLRAEKIGFVFQQFHLVPYLSVYDNIRLPELSDMSGKRSRTVDDLLEEFGLTGRKRHLPYALSTGERQRTALARALYNEPSIICADEPTGNLDDKNAEIVLKHLRSFAENSGCVLLVTHDNRAGAYADRVYRIESGEIIPVK